MDESTQYVKVNLTPENVGELFKEGNNKFDSYTYEFSSESYKYNKSKSKIDVSASGNIYGVGIKGGFNKENEKENTETESESTKISFEWAAVDFHRPWMNFDIFKNKTFTLRGCEKG